MVLSLIDLVENISLPLAIGLSCFLGFSGFAVRFVRDPCADCSIAVSREQLYPLSRCTIPSPDQIVDTPSVSMNMMIVVRYSCSSSAKAHLLSVSASRVSWLGRRMSVVGQVP
jgi:hypothetical protein